MKRYVSIWLPHWPIGRLYRQNGRRASPDKPADISRSQPLVLVAKARGGFRVMAANHAAQHAGVMVDQLLADARVLCPILKVYDYDPGADEADLNRLAHWCIRYSPWVTSDPPDGIVIDITGSAHLFGGEDALARNISRRLRKFGFRSRIGIAKTIGAAWAVSRFGGGEWNIVGDEETAAALSSLPIVALRIGHDVSDRLEQVGLKTIGALIGRPRAPLVARYGVNIVKRLDQALGHVAENLSPVAELPNYRAYQQFPEPISLLEQVGACLADLTSPLADMLKKASLGARRFELSLYRVDGDVKSLSVRRSALCNEPSHIERLFQEKLEKLNESYDVGFGIEQIVLNAYDTEIMIAEQPSLDRTRAEGSEAQFNMLIDRYGNRLGFENIGRFLPNESHIPERSERLVPVTAMPAETKNWAEFLHRLQGGSYLGRPIALLPHPEPISAIAEVPDGPPIRFEWRRVIHRVTRAEGPERIAPEWWGRFQMQAEPTRDYFRIEDNEGYRFWLFRQGLYERQENPHWFMHGLFA